MKQLLISALAFTITGILAILPRVVSMRLGEAVGSLAYTLWRKRRRIAVKNLRAAIKRGAIRTEEAPEHIIRRNFINMGRSVAELSKVYYGMGRPIMDSVTIEGIEHFEAARAKGKGVILVGGHCGNWELMVLLIASQVGSMHGIAKRQPNPFVNHFIISAREKFGSGIVYKEGALRKLLGILKKGESIGVLIDQSVMPEEGVLVDFLGAKVWATKMPAIIAKKTGAPVLAGFIKRTPQGHAFHLTPEIPITGDEVADTQRLTSHIERYVADNPAEWLWIHRRWKRTGKRWKAKFPELFK